MSLSLVDFDLQNVSCVIAKKINRRSGWRKFFPLYCWNDYVWNPRSVCSFVQLTSSTPTSWRDPWDIRDRCCFVRRMVSTAGWLMISPTDRPMTTALWWWGKVVAMVPGLSLGSVQPMANWRFGLLQSRLKPITILLLMSRCWKIIFVRETTESIRRKRCDSTTSIL